MKNSLTEIEAELFRLQDEKYRDFQIKLIPGYSAETMIGVRTPELRKLAKKIFREGEYQPFLDSLPHRLFEENQLHSFIISEIKDFDECAEAVSRFLPFVDNWATCDQMTPKVFGKTHEKLLGYINRWLSSGETYSVRFAVKMLMDHFLDEDFDIAFPEMVAGVRSEEYYVKMAVAWYFATALAKQYEAVLPFIENRRLDDWAHNKAIQKANESFRVSDEQKAHLKGLKIKTIVKQ